MSMSNDKRRKAKWEREARRKAERLAERKAANFRQNQAIFASKPKLSADNHLKNRSAPASPINHYRPSLPNVGAHAPLTPAEFLAPASPVSIPRMSATRVSADNIDEVLRNVSVSDDALASTKKAVQSVVNMPGVVLESNHGRLIASQGGQEIFELPVFQKSNILTKGGTRWFSIGKVRRFEASGANTESSFAEWFNKTISDIADNTGLDIKDRRANLQDQIGFVFGQIHRDGEGGRAMVEPLSSSGREKTAQAVIKSRTTAFDHPLDSKVGVAMRDMEAAQSEVYKAAGSGKGRSAALTLEEKARERYTRTAFEEAGTATRTGAAFSDSVFSATGKAIIDPQVTDQGMGGAQRIIYQLTDLQPRDIHTFSDADTAAKGFSQIRHKTFYTHDELAKADATARQSNAGVPDAIKPDRARNIIQTQAVFDMEQQAQKLRGKKGTMSPMGKVLTFIDQEVADQMLKDSGAIRSNISHLNDPALARMDSTYTKKMVISSSGDNLLEGILDPNIHKAIKAELKKQQARGSRQTLEFGTFGAEGGSSGGMGIKLSKGNLIGANITSSGGEGGMPLPGEVQGRQVKLDHADDTIEGIKIRDGQVEFNIKRAHHRTQLGGALLVGEKRITAGRTMDIKTTSGAAADLIVDSAVFKADDDGVFRVAGEKGARNNPGGDFYRRQFQTIANRFEKKFGGVESANVMEVFAESFGLRVEKGMDKAPTLIADPDLQISYKQGLKNLTANFGKIVGSGAESTFASQLDELTKVEMTTLHDKTIKQMLTESGVMENDLIQDTRTGQKVSVHSDEGKSIFRSYQARMAVIVQDEVIVERQDRVGSVGIKADGRSAAQIKASRMGYVKESILTRGMAAGDATTAKIFQDFDQIILNQGMKEGNPLVFDELRRIAEPFRGSAGLGTINAKTTQQVASELGGGLPDLTEFRMSQGGKAPVPAHMLKGSMVYDDVTLGLRTEGMNVDLGHEVKLTGGRQGSGGGVFPGTAKSSNLYIPSPASVLNKTGDKSIFLPRGGMQNTYIELIERIADLGGSGKATTAAEAQSIADLYNKFSVEFAEEAVGKTGALAKAGLNPTAARYGQLSAMPHLKGDVVGVTEEGFEEFLSKSSYSDDMKAEIRSRAQSNNLKVGFLADPMGSREHYRAVELKILKGELDPIAPSPVGKSKPSAKGVLYVTDSILSMGNRDLDADNATISLLSSTSEHVKGHSGMTEREIFELEQRAMDQLHDAQSASSKAIQQSADARFTDTLADALDNGTRSSIGMDGDQRIVGEAVEAGEAGAISAGRTNPAVRTPVPEVMYHKQSGISEILQRRMTQGKVSGASGASVVQEVVSDIMNRSTKGDGMRGQVTQLVEAMVQSTGHNSQFHNVIKYQLLKKSAEVGSNQATATNAFFDELQTSVAKYSDQRLSGQLATDNLDNLTSHILDVMSGKEAYEHLKTDLAGSAAFPSGIDPGTDPRQFARIVARELVAAEAISNITGYSNPADLVAKQSANLLGTAEGLDSSRPKVNQSGGAVAVAGDYQGLYDETPPQANIADRIADANTVEGQAAARAAGGPVNPTPQATTTTRPPTFIEEISRLGGLAKGVAADAGSGLKSLFQNSAGFRYGLAAAGGVVGLEIIRSTVSGFSGPNLATPTAPMPPSPNIGQPMDATFDSRMLPQQNRTRIQRTPGMRSHTSISGQADAPVDFGGMNQPPMGGHSTPTYASGHVQDSRRNQAAMDEEARRRLHAAY